jgi:hydroxypyruvate isomerase
MKMTRRDAIKAGVAAGAALATGTALGANPRSSGDFKLKYSPHFGMFQNSAGPDLVDQLKFAREQGFHGWEDNGMKGRSVQDQERIAKAMTDLGITMGVFVVNMGTAWSPTLATGQQQHLDRFLEECRESVEVAKRVNAKWMTVVPGLLDHRIEMDYQTANVVEALRRASEIFEPHDLVMVLEPLNHWANHPQLFLSKIPQAFLICRAVNSPACKILDDLYHQQIQEGNLIPNMDRAWSEIAYFQVGDNPGRNEPLTGEINYRNVFKHLHARGFQGVVGMEHSKSQGGVEGERKLIEAYRYCDDF